MKLLFFDDYRLGVVRQDMVADVTDVVSGIPHSGPHDLISGLIERFAEFRDAIEKASKASTGIALERARIKPPLPRPVNIDCMAVNYIEDPNRPEPPPINVFPEIPKRGHWGW